MTDEMSRRAFLGEMAKAAAALALSSLPALAATETPARLPSRPNFLFINTDQQRFDTLRSYGCDFALTPNIDRLAEEGVRFDRCYISHPVCMPSRASWVTGCYPSHHGVWHNGVPLNPNADMIHTRLKDAGYHTACIGKLHLDNIVERKVKHPPYGFDLLLDAQGDPYYQDDYYQWLDRHDLYDSYVEQFRKGGHRKGYTRDIDENRHMNNWMVGHAETYLTDRARDGKPFFLHMGFFDPHHPFDPCEPYASLYHAADMPLPLYQEGEIERMTPPAKAMVRADSRDADFIRNTRAAYYAKVAHIDAMVGRVMATLARTGLEDNTIIIFTSDHGEMLGDHSLLLKGPLFYEGALRIPLIYRFPRRFNVKGVDAGYVSHVDFAPTVAALAGIDGPSRVQGAPLFDRQLRLRPTPARDAALTEWCDRGINAGGKHLVGRCLITDRWKLVYYHGEEFGELYDRANDPHEYRNLWADPGYVKARAEMRDRLFAFIIDNEPRPQRTKDF